MQICVPISGHHDNEVDNFCQQLQETIDQIPKKNILVVQHDWNAYVGRDAQADWGEMVPSPRKAKRKSLTFGKSF